MSQEQAKTNHLPPIPSDKMALWLKHYLDDTNPETFINQTKSAIYAEYKANSYNGFATIGKENYKKLQPYIAQWLDEYGLSENRLKLKLVSLTESHKTIFQKVKGRVDSDSLAPNVSKVAETHKVMCDHKGKTGDDPDYYDDGETLLAIDVNDPELQRKSLDMALKVRDLYTGDKDGVNNQHLTIVFISLPPAVSEELQRKLLTMMQPGQGG